MHEYYDHCNQPLTQITRTFLHNYPACLQYSPYQARLTFDKQSAPLSAVWAALVELRRQGDVRRFLFRTMDTEETLANILNAQGREAVDR